MDDILESIESGVAEERGRGTLNQAQADVRPVPGFLCSPNCGMFTDLPTRVLGFAPESVEPQNQNLIIPIYLSIPFNLSVY